MDSRRALRAAALLSVLLHAGLLWILTGVEITQPADPDALEPVRVVLQQPAPPAAPPPRRQPPPPPPAIPAPPPAPAEPPPAPEPEAPPAPEVEKAPELEIPLPEQQIVAVPDGGREEAPPDTRLLSDRDNKVDEQMIRKGEPEASREEAPIEDDKGDGEDGTDGDAAIAAAVPPPPRPREPSARAPLPGLSELLPGALTLAARQRDSAVNEPPPPTPAGTGGRRNRRAEDWQPQTTLRGSLDYLPDVQAGHLTLLNTKADLFAPFVRRVMVRVFQNMLILLRRAAPSIRGGGRERVQAEAVMDPSGTMLTITIQERSTTMAIGLDRMLREACDAAFFDRNPPPGAEAADGNIHFVLETVIQAIPTERGVEISGIFGVGLL